RAAALAEVRYVGQVGERHRADRRTGRAVPGAEAATRGVEAVRVGTGWRRDHVLRVEVRRLGGVAEVLGGLDRLVAQLGRAGLARCRLGVVEPHPAQRARGRVLDVDAGRAAACGALRYPFAVLVHDGAPVVRGTEQAL